MRLMALSRRRASFGSALLLPEALVMPDLSVIMVRLERLETEDMLSRFENCDWLMFIS